MEKYLQVTYDDDHEELNAFICSLLYTQQNNLLTDYRYTPLPDFT
jgi:hypothetical protein